jgi:hypothetical protein
MIEAITIEGVENTNAAEPSKIDRVSKIKPLSSVNGKDMMMIPINPIMPPLMM